MDLDWIWIWTWAWQYYIDTANYNLGIGILFGLVRVAGRIHSLYKCLFLFIFYAREQWKPENEKIQTDTEDIRSLNVRRKQGGIYIRLVNKPVINSNKLTNEHLKFRTAIFLKPTFFSISFSDWTSIMEIRFLSPVPVVTCLSSPVVFSKFSARIWFTEKHGQLDKMTGWY